MDVGAGGATSARQRPPWRGLLAATALGGIWRFGYLLAAKRHQPLLLNDSLYYSSQASQLAHGIWFKDVLGRVDAAEHGPMTAIALAPVSRLGDPIFWQRLANASYGTCTVLLIGLLAWWVAGRRAAIIAACIAAVYPNLWMNDVVVMSESVALLSVTGALLMTLVAIERGRWWRFALAGLLFGVATLARSELVLLTGVIAVVTVWSSRGLRGWRRAVPGALVLAGGAVVLAPWIVFNLARFERPVLLTTNSSTTLIGANCPEVYAGPGIGSWSVLCVLDNLAEPLDGDASVRAEQQQRAAVRYALDHADRVPVVVLARVARSADLWGYSDLVHQDVGEERARWAVWAGIVSWLVMAPLAALGLRRLDPVPRRVLAAPIVSVFVVSAIYYGAHRIRAPLEPAVVVLAATALAAIPWRRTVDC
jgi:4-amino-4-deoxy-L-arabinose transferase-like glycosyltransferase